jgi:hypothetical protein
MLLVVIHVVMLLCFCLYLLRVVSMWFCCVVVVLCEVFVCVAHSLCFLLRVGRLVFLWNKVLKFASVSLT